MKTSNASTTVLWVVVAASLLVAALSLAALRASRRPRVHVIRSTHPRSDRQLRRTLRGLLRGAEELVDAAEAAGDAELAARLRLRLDELQVVEMHPRETALGIGEVEDKQTIYLCARTGGGSVLENPEVLRYVFLHELAHAVSDATGHTEEFHALHARLAELADSTGFLSKDVYDGRTVQFCNRKFSPEPPGSGGVDN